MAYAAVGCSLSDKANMEVHPPEIKLDNEIKPQRNLKKKPIKRRARKKKPPKRRATVKVPVKQRRARKPKVNPRWLAHVSRLVEREYKRGYSGLMCPFFMRSKEPVRRLTWDEMLGMYDPVERITSALTSPDNHGLRPGPISLSDEAKQGGESYKIEFVNEVF